MLNIVCVNHGNFEGRGAEYVNVLFDMIRRNLAEGFPGRFVCFTDDPTGLDPVITARELPKGLKGWFNKLYLFSPGLFEEGDRILYFDLDTLITGRLDEIASYSGEFIILRDLFHEYNYPNKELNYYQSAVMGWRAGFGTEIWDEFEKSGRPEVPGGDQTWIGRFLKSPDIYQDRFPGLFCSYKASGRKLPEKESVVCFHGKPRPHEIVDGWVPMVWKIGGITKAELDVICNTEKEKIHGQVRHSCSLGLPSLNPSTEHDRHACIVGGGPSLSDSLNEIRLRKNDGQEIWATNNTHDWLIDKGIKPDVCVILDAREENAKFVEKPEQGIAYYIASQCHPKVFENLKGQKVVLYHNASDYDMQDLLLEVTTDDQIHMLGGGTTVGMKAIAIARFLGYRFFHLYGMDSCYLNEEGHAYPQALNDSDRTLDVICEGRTFKCAPWMVTQSNDFIEVARMLADQDCIVTVAGDGLLAHIARTMTQPQEPDTEIVEIGGLWWPSKDREKAIIMDRTRDIASMLAECRGFDVAIQAGGNCGIWPAILAKHFGTVYTWEPDWLNFQCLVRNATDKNIIKFQAGLGNAHEFVDLARNPSNCGAHHIRGRGAIPIMKIDDLNLQACDLIQLDIEGYELNALKGAERTIRRFKPVIVIEENGSSKRYGVKSGDTAKWIERLGYNEASRVHRDIIFTPKTQPKEAVNA